MLLYQINSLYLTQRHRYRGSIYLVEKVDAKPVNANLVTVYVLRLNTNGACVIARTVDVVKSYRCYTLLNIVH